MTRPTRKLRWLLACVVAALALAPTARAAGGGGERKPGKKRAKPGKAKAPSGKKGSDSATGPLTFAVMKKELGLGGKQASRLQSLWKARSKALAEWKASPDGERLAWLAEQRALGNTARADLSESVALTRARDALTRTHDEAIFRKLTPAQRRQWLAFVLYRAVAEIRRRAAAPLTAAQAARARKVCQDLAQPHTGGYPSPATLAVLISRAAEAVADKTGKTQKGSGSSKGPQARKKSSKKGGKKGKGGKARGKKPKVPKPKVPRPKVPRPSVAGRSVPKPSVPKPSAPKPGS